MKNMKFIKFVLLVGSLVVTTSTFADIPSTISSEGITTGIMSNTSSSTSSKSHLSAFANIPTAAVSPDELNKTSGEMLPLVYIGGILVARYAVGKVVKKVTCGSSKGCKAS